MKADYLSTLFLIAGISLLSVFQSNAEDITTTDGSVYKNATVTKAEPFALNISFEEGLARIPFEKLPEDIRQKYGYGPEQAAAYKKQLVEEQERYRESISTRLGETPQQIEKRYGKPITPLQEIDEHWTKLAYKYYNFFIEVSYIDGICQHLEFQKSDNSRFRDDEIEAIMRSNSAGGEWFRDYYQVPEGVSLWLRSKNDVTVATCTHCPEDGKPERVSVFTPKFESYLANQANIEQTQMLKAHSEKLKGL